MELGALTPDLRLPRAGERPRHLRADHRPADEPRVHPARRRRAGPAGRRGRGKIREFLRKAPADGTTCDADRRQPDLQGPHRGRRLPRPDRLHGPRRDRADPARHRPAARTCASRSRTAATRPTSSTSRPSTPATATAATGSGWPRWNESLRSSSSAWTGWRPGPVMVDPGQEDRLARPAVARPGRPGQLARAHRAHHGPVHGGPDPPLQAGDRGLPGAGGPGLRGDRVAQGRARLPRGQRRRHPAVPGALPRPLVHQPAGRGRDVRGRHDRRRDRRRGVDRPGDGRRGSTGNAAFSIPRKRAGPG
jgi:hypothetical protein